MNRVPTKWPAMHYPRWPAIMACDESRAYKMARHALSNNGPRFIAGHKNIFILNNLLLVVLASTLEAERLRLDEKFFPAANAGVLTLDYLVTGVGPTATALALGAYLARGPRPDYCLQLGIGGSYDLDLPLTSVVRIKTETWGDLGATDAQGAHLSLVDLGLLPSEQALWTAPPAFVGEDLPSLHGLTVHNSSGEAQQIAQRRAKFPHAQIESMEGAAFFQTCAYFGLERYAQIRAVSNYVEPRCRENWRIPQALEALSASLETLVKALSQS